MTQFPRMAVAIQQFDRTKVQSTDAALAQTFAEAEFSTLPLQGKKIAVAVGSRGISSIAAIVKNTVETLKRAGAIPFVIPAMGSHGGGTEAGQAGLLANYGVASDRIGAPVDASLETVPLGETPDGVPVYIARSAWQADGVILINRIKPHTDFHGDFESGLMKMIAIGLGKIHGANAFHSRTHLFPSSEMIRSIARVVLAQGKVLGGVAILENAYHETARLEWVPASRMEEREKVLLPEAKKLMPSLPVEKADILLIDEIGKNISGTGLDPNITGRCYRLNSVWQEKPDITRIVALDLTDDSHGNAVGIGLTDFCHRRIVDKMDRMATYLNAIISRNTPNAAIPMYYDNSRELLEHVMLSIGESVRPEQMRLLRIRNTLDIERILVSEALVPELRNHPQIASLSELREMEFDSRGDLIELRRMNF
ncbi:MAG: lactate racemase domain-containing protein [Candidatus Omnitrophota bacterium]